MNAGAKYILASYMSLFGPFPPHAPLPYVTKTRFNSRISLVVCLLVLDLATCGRILDLVCMRPIDMV